MSEHSIWLAFGLTMIAGLSTGIGSLITLIAKRTNKEFLSAALGLSAGVMIYVSFMDLIPTAKEGFVSLFDEKKGTLVLILAFFGGMGLTTLIDFLIPKENNPHEMQGVEDMNILNGKQKTLYRIGVLTAISLAIHNFPEGIAAFTTAMAGDLSVSIPITAAIAIHNIPEGIAVAVLIYHATGNRRKAFWFSFLSGLAEPLGALAAWLFLMPFWSPMLDGIIMAAVAGIMIYISHDELLPTAEKHGKHHTSIAGLITGMILMALCIYIFV